MGKLIPFRKVIRRKPPRKVTPELLWELLRIHAQCPPDQMGKCGLTVFCKSLASELNAAMNLPDEEGEGFRRVDPMCAAKPLDDSHGALPVRTVYPNKDKEVE